MAASEHSDPVELDDDLADSGAVTLGVVVGLLVQGLYWSSDKTTKIDFICPTSLGLILRRIGATSADEKFVGKTLTASV